MRYALRAFLLRPPAAGGATPTLPSASCVPAGPRVSLTTCWHNCWNAALWLTHSTWRQAETEVPLPLFPLPLSVQNRRATCRCKGPSQPCWQLWSFPCLAAPSAQPPLMR